jgi:hypothetical protein
MFVIPKRLDKYEFVPSIGASGGILVAWNGNLFSGLVIDSQQFSITLNSHQHLTYKNGSLL